VIRALLALFLFGLSATASSAPQRVVSLNLCTDQMLVLLAPEKVVGLTPLARDPALSFVARQAASLPVVRPSAEAVLRLHPDLVLAAPFGAQATVAVLTALGVNVRRVGLPSDFAGIRAETRRLAAALGVAQRGEALITAMDEQLASLRPPPGRRTAIAWEPRGYTSGPGTLMDAVLRAAGLTNMGNGRLLGREALLRDPPDLLIVPDVPDYPSLATGIFDDPVLAKIRRQALPPALTLCAGPFTARATSILAR
jgi:iron complex transport system substrate-binding protein